MTEPGVGLPFRNWQQLLEKSASGTEPGRTFLSGKAPGWGTSGHCSVPLLSVPLPEYYDEAMVQKMPPHPDDKMSITPPPDCPLHTGQANPPKRK